MSSENKGAGHGSELGIVVGTMHTDPYNNRFGPNGERVNALNPQEDQYPTMAVYDIGLEAEMRATVKKAVDGGYIGNVTAIHPGALYESMNAIFGEGPVNFFAMQTNSHYVRSNKYGAPTTILQTLKPDFSGAVAVGEVTGQGTTGPTTQPPATPAATVMFTPSGWPKKGQEKARTFNLMGGGVGVYEFTIPLDAVEGFGQMTFGDATGGQGNPVALRVLVNGAIDLDWESAFAGVAPAPGYALREERSKDAPLHFRRGDTVRAEVRPTGDKPNDMIVDHRTPR